MVLTTKNEQEFYEDKESREEFDFNLGEEIYEELELMEGLENRDKYNKHREDYIKELENGEYYKDLLIDYYNYKSKGEPELTDKQLQTAIAVEKVLKRRNFDIEGFIEESSKYYKDKLKNDDLKVLKRKERRTTKHKLSDFKNVDVNTALEFATEVENEVEDNEEKLKTSSYRRGYMI